jgi:hypothetical protein
LLASPCRLFGERPRPDIEGVGLTPLRRKKVLDKAKEFSPVADWKQLVGFVILVAVSAFIIKKLPIPASFK